MKNIIKWACVVILTPILLFIILALLFYLPPIQNWVVKQVTAYASEKTGLTISIEHVNLEFPLDLGVEEVKVLQPNDMLPQVKDTVADIRKVVVDVCFLPLLKQQVYVDELKFEDAKINTTNLIPSARVRGMVGKLELQSHGIDLKKKILRVNQASLADTWVDVALSDTVPPDTTKSENFWKIYVDSLQIAKTQASVHMPGDTLQVQVRIEETVAKGGFFDLYKSLYQVNSLRWHGGHLAYDNVFEDKVKGLDLNHLLLSDVLLDVDSFSYYAPDLRMNLLACAFKERSGIRVTQLAGTLAMDSTRLHLPNLVFRTPESLLRANFNMDLNAFDAKNPGRMNAVVHGAFGKQDLMLMLADMPTYFKRNYPNYPLTIDGVIRGNMQRISFNGLNVKLPTAFRLNADGYVVNPMDNRLRRGEIRAKANTYNLSFVSAFLSQDMRKTINIPQGIGIEGKFDMKGNSYGAAFLMTEGKGRVQAKAMIDIDRMAYSAKLDVRNLALQRFVPNQGLSEFTGYIDVKGNGVDFMSPRTSLDATARIERFHYGSYNLDNVMAQASMRKGVAKARVNSQNPLLAGVIDLDGLTTGKRMKMHIKGNVDKADLYRLKIMDTPFSAQLQANVSIESDWKNFYKVSGAIENLTITDTKSTYNPGDVRLDILSSKDTTHAVISSGDFDLRLNARGGYNRLLKEIDRLVAEVESQLKNKKIDEVRLREHLPLANIYLKSGKNNSFIRMLNKYGYSVDDVFADFQSSPITGLNGDLALGSLVADSIQIDTVWFKVRSDDSQMAYSAQVRNNKKNPQYVFNALLDGTIEEKGTDIRVRLFDAKDKLGLDLGLTGTMETDGVKVSVMGKKSVLGYKNFTVNDSNYVFLGDDRRLRADMKLRADDGTGFQILTDNDNTEALQDVTFSVNQLNLEHIFSVIPYTPNITGTLNGDFHLIQTHADLSVSSAVTVDNMTYEQSGMGNLHTEFVYMPKSDGTHYVDAILKQNNREIGWLTGTYASKKDEAIDATLYMDKLPLSLMNGFIPERIIGFKGYAEGELSVKGTVSQPRINGELQLDSARIFSEPYGVELRFADDPVRITNSHILFENFEMFANNDKPITSYGTFDFSDIDNMKMDVRMRAENCQIIDAKENMRSEVYGKAFVNFFGRMNGPVDNLRLRGRLDVLDATDMTYILKDSPLSTDNQMDELVVFTEFSDSVEYKIERPPLTGFDMDLSVNIDNNAHIICALNADQSNYVDLTGGGDLRLQYNPVDEIRLRGRYTLNNGEMKYSLPVIPLKTFTIKDGSYIEFTGDAMNPRLNITATETVRASVAENGGDSRIVEFECGVVITKTLQDMGLEFIINAPQDMTLSNQFNTMGKEERGKLAVTMLTTGMFLADGNTKGFSMNGALSAFLQSQINNITGNALKTLDLSFGLDNVTDASGNMHTDYSFKFAKRLWNNRLRVIVGGKVSSGTDVSQKDNTFFDNVSLEYRLNQGSTKYLQMFYIRDSYDWLEGDVSKYGAGFIWRRKLSHFKDIFNFKDKKDNMLPPLAEPDTTKIKKDGIKE